MASLIILYFLALVIDIAMIVCLLNSNVKHGISVRVSDLFFAFSCAMLPVINFATCIIGMGILVWCGYDTLIFRGRKE